MPQKRDDLARGGDRGDRSFRGESACPTCGGADQRVSPTQLGNKAYAQCQGCHTWYDTPYDQSQLHPHPPETLPKTLPTPSKAPKPVRDVHGREVKHWPGAEKGPA